MSLTFAVLVLGQAHNGGPIFDEFGSLSNDDLQARVMVFLDNLHSAPDYRGIVVLYGPRFDEHIMRRRIEGCGLMLRQPVDELTFVFGPPQGEGVITKFYALPKSDLTNIEPPDFKLPALRSRVELTASGYSDDFCPRHFDLKWLAGFMAANPQLAGRAVIDTTAKDFARRVRTDVTQLRRLGIDPKRVRFIRRHFPHETDEQWWLIPRK